MIGLRSSLLGLAAAALGLLAEADEAREGEPVLLKGAKAGHWTMDVDAARQYAARKNLPLLLNFTGSDWCGWCKVMDDSVFHKEEWKEFAADHVVLVTIDFPRGSNIVPKKWKERNSQLKKHFGVRGYPTYVIVAPDGETKLGHLMANGGKTPESFIREFQKILKKAAAHRSR
jgi:protein disulfide-isomerase